MEGVTSSIVVGKGSSEIVTDNFYHSYIACEVDGVVFGSNTLMVCSMSGSEMTVIRVRRKRRFGKLMLNKAPVKYEKKMVYSTKMSRVGARTGHSLKNHVPTKHVEFVARV